MPARDLVRPPHVKLIASTSADGPDENCFQSRDGRRRRRSARRLLALCLSGITGGSTTCTCALNRPFAYIDSRRRANGIDLTLTYISISFTEFMRAGKKSRERRKIQPACGRTCAMADNKVRSARRSRYRAVSTQGMRVDLADRPHAISLSLRARAEISRRTHQQEF